MAATVSTLMAAGRFAFAPLDGLGRDQGTGFMGGKALI